MAEKSKHKIPIIIIISLLLFYYLLSFNKQNYSILLSKLFSNNFHHLQVIPFYELFNSSINKKTILIFEPNEYHHECSPGYSEYFVSLGYNVDVLMHLSGIDSFCLFQNIEKIRVLTFKKLSEIKKKAKHFSVIIKKYDFVLLQTTDRNKEKLYIKLGLLNITNIIFVFHNINFINFLYSKYLKKNRIWTLGSFSKGLRVNPHYFGDIRIKDKNYKTKFFMTSTLERNYKYLMECVEKLKEENFNFEIIVTGRSTDFNIEKISDNLIDNFIFKHKVSYSELYKAIEISDYIIIPINPNDKYANEYKTIKVSGSIQLAYGFLKPVLIHQEFSKFYNLDHKNSLIYNNSNLYEVMRKAILLNKMCYKKLQSNLHLIEKEIYKSSINNIKRTLKK